MDRYLSRLDVWAMSFGVAVGWGAFVMPGTTFLPVAGPAGTLLAMGISVLVMLVIGMNLAYLMRRSPRTGGIYSYTKEAFGRDHAFLSSWFLCLSYLTVVFLNGTAIFVVVRTMFGDATQNGPFYTVAGNNIYLWEVAVSALALMGIGALFVFAKPLLQRLHTALAVLMLAGIVVTGIACVPRALRPDVLTSFGSAELKAGYGVFSIIILAPWAFVGFEVPSFDTAHYKFDVKHSLPLIILAIIISGLAYSALTLVSLSDMPPGYADWQQYISALGDESGVAAVPTFYAARSIMGNAGLVILTITALAAILTGIIGAYRAAMRVLSTMAEDKILSDRFSNTTYSILFIMVLSILLSLMGRNTLNWFVDLTSFGAIVGFGYTSAAAWKIARTEANRAVQVTGLTGAAISIAFVIVQLVPHLTAMEAMGSEAFLLLALWCLMGFVFYWRTVMRSTLTEFSGISISGVALFALLIYSSIMWLGKRLMAAPNIEAARDMLVWGGLVVLAIIFIGLMVMLYVQNLVRLKHEVVEREKIRAVEGSLAKSQFLFNMSHDIRTPMNAIVGYTELALREEASDTVKGYLGKIESSSQHLLALINDVLEMSRIENGKVELEYAPADLREVFEGMRDLFAEQMRQKNLDFQVHMAQLQNHYVWCDVKNLNRVLLNVLSNAYKFTPQGGSISLSIWETGNGENGYGSYEIRVQDSGIGMSREFVDKMFNAFERERTSTNSGVEGTGLGLAITKTLVDLMGGNIEVLTTQGSGTQFIIRLKLRLSSEEELRASAGDEGETAEQVDFSQKRLLLVDDNAVNLEIANMILEQMGFTVETAENGKAALDMVAAAPPGHYDAVLMDIQMPVMDGYEATSAIRALEDERRAAVPIIAMTANAFAEDVRAAEQAGMQGHISKPIDMRVLQQTLAKVLG